MNINLAEISKRTGKSEADIAKAAAAAEAELKKLYDSFDPLASFKWIAIIAAGAVVFAMSQK